MALYADTSNLSFDQLMQQIQNGQYTFQSPTQQGLRFNSEDGGYYGGGGFMDQAPVADPRTGPSFDAYGAQQGNGDISWLTYAKNHGLNQDWTQATPQQQGEYTAFQSQFKPTNGMLNDAFTTNPVIPFLATAGLSAGLPSLLGPTGIGGATGTAAAYGPEALGEVTSANFGAGAGAGGLVGGAATGTAAALPAITDAYANAGAPLANGGSGLGLTGAAGATGATGSALSRILNGTATADDWLKTAGTVGATALGAYTANDKANSLSDLANQYFNIGAPSRARYEGSFAPGFTMANDPGYTDAINQSTDALTRKASVGGNPFGNPGVLTEILKNVNASTAYPALQNYRNQNAATGGYSAFNTAAPSAATNSVNAQGGALTNIAGGLSDILNPQPKSQFNLNDLLNQIKLNSGGIV